MNETLHHVLRSLEERLLTPELRKQPETLATLLTEDFQEFGKSGNAYDRAAVLASLAAEEPQALSLHDFKVQLLGPEAALATYSSHAADGSQARRSSVWVYRQGRWQMLFHQGTAI